MDSFQDKMKEWIEKVSNTNTVTDTEMQNVTPKMYTISTKNNFNILIHYKLY